MANGSAAPGRGKLIETAAALFAAAGFDGVSTKQLAAKAGLSIGALYHHFPTKEAAYRAAVEWGLSRISPPPESWRDPHEPALRQLERQVAWFCRSVAAPTVESQLLRMELLDPHLDSRLSDLAPFAHSFSRYQTLMAEAAPEADCELVLAAIVSLSFGLSRLGGLQRQTPAVTAAMRDTDEIARLVMRLIFSPERT